MLLLEMCSACQEASRKASLWLLLGGTQGISDCYITFCRLPMEHYLEHTMHISLVEYEFLLLNFVGKPVSSVYESNL